MFTFKKIALLGVAGLVAFSMSCSDTLEEGSGEFKNLVLDRDNEGSVYIKTGSVVADDGITVTAVKATSNDKALAGLSGLELNVKVVNLAGVTLGGICTANNSTKDGKYEIVFAATFSDGTTTEYSVEQNVNCSTSFGPGEDPALVKNTITLGFASPNKSYADIDGTPTPYGQADVTGSVAIAKKIDLVAYAINGAENKVYTIGGAIDEDAVPQTVIDYFDSNVGAGTYYGILSYDLPPEAVAIIKNASKLSDVADFISGVDSLNDNDGINTISVGSGFLVFTSEKKYVAVIVNSGGTASTVTLGTTGGMN